MRPSTVQSLQAWFTKYDGSVLDPFCYGGHFDLFRDHFEGGHYDGRSSVQYSSGR